MIPVHLQLTNFLSYRETVDVDFTKLHLACISGHNGAGKSTLLDAMTWALFGEARSSNDALIYSGADQAEVILDFEYEGLAYRIQRRKPREKTGILDFFLAHQQEDGTLEWKPLTETSITRTQQKIISTLRMDYETFTNASFFLQGKADQFAQKNPTERKKVLVSILGLDIWDAYNKKAAEKRKNREADRALIDARNAEINEELSEEAIRKERFEELSKSLKQYARQKKSQEDALNRLRLLDSMLKEQKKQLEASQVQLSNKRKSLEQTVQLLAERKNEQAEMTLLLSRTDEITSGYKKWKTMRQSLEEMDSLGRQYHNLREQKTAPYLILEKTRNIMEQEVRNLTEKMTIAEALQKVIPIRKKELQLDLKVLTVLMTQTEQKPAIDNQKEILRLEKEDRSVENKRLKAEMDHLAARRENLQTTKEPLCPFCGQDLSHDHREQLVEEIEADGKILGDEYRENQSRLNDIEAKIKALDGDLQTLARIETEVHALQRKTDVSQAWLSEHEPEVMEWEAAGKVRLQEVETILKEETYAGQERALLAKLEEEILALKYDPDTHDNLRNQESGMRPIDSDYQLLEKTRSAITPLERQINDLDAQLSQSRQEMDSLETNAARLEKDYEEKSSNLPDLADAEVEFRQTIEGENTLRDETTAARQKVEVLDVLRIKKKEFELERESVSKVIDQYKQLERAFGKDGVPALLIEQALPEIETEANDLLERLTSGEMSVRFLTQREYKDKNREDKKETLDIQISDGTGARNYEMFSGGEAFRVNFAIRLALSRVLAQRAGARLQTLVIDEGFGSQDAVGRQRLVEAINLVQADFAKILVITHLEELKDVFPSRIEVEKTSSGSTVTVTN